MHEAEVKPDIAVGHLCRDGGGDEVIVLVTFHIQSSEAFVSYSHDCYGANERWSPTVRALAKLCTLLQNLSAVEPDTIVL